MVKFENYFQKSRWLSQESGVIWTLEMDDLTTASKRGMPLFFPASQGRKIFGFYGGKPWQHTRNFTRRAIIFFIVFPPSKFLVCCHGFSPLKPKIILPCAARKKKGKPFGEEPFWKELLNHPFLCSILHHSLVKVNGFFENNFQRSHFRKLFPFWTRKRFQILALWRKCSAALDAPGKHAIL